MVPIAPITRQPQLCSAESCRFSNRHREDHGFPIGRYPLTPTYEMISETLATFVDAIADRRFDRWRNCFAPEPSIRFGTAPADPQFVCETLFDLWTQLGGTTTWDSVYTVHSVIALDDWMAVTRLVTILDDDGGTIWEGVDSFKFSEDGLIESVDSHDNRLIGLIS